MQNDPPFIPPRTGGKPEVKTRAEISVTTENVWFVERHLNLFDILELFPMDSVSSEGNRGIPITFHTHLGFDIVSDIDRSKMALRNRSKLNGWMRWTTEVGLKAEDVIVIEKTGEREYELRLETRD